MFRLRTFGCLALTRDGAVATGRVAQRRRLALLALLAAARDTGVGREKLLAYFWPERDAEHARHLLSQALYEIRQALGEGAIVVGTDGVRLDPRVCPSDVDDFLSAIAAGDLTAATDACVGAFLDGFFLSEAPEFERWADGERDRLAALHRRAVEALATRAHQSGDLGEEVDRRRELCALDPLSSGAALRYAEALVRTGDAARALRHLRVHATLLREELGVALPHPLAELEARLARPATVAAAIGDEVRVRGGATAAAPGQIAVGGGPPAAPGAGATVAGPVADDTVAALPAHPEHPHAVDSLSALGGVPRRGVRRRWARAVAAVLVLGVTASGVAYARRSPPNRGHYAIVLGDIVGSDADLALAVHDALRAELEALPGIRITDDATVRGALQLMRLPPTAPVSGEVATQVARRRGVPFALTGSARRLGAGAQFVIELRDAETDATIATLTERPATEGEMIPAVTRLTTRLGEQLAALHVATAPTALPPVTTSSLPALLAFVRARQARDRFDMPAAIRLGEAAILDDSLFALAHYFVGDALWYVDEEQHAEQHLGVAYRLSERLPPRERLVVHARYEQLVRDRPDSALAYWDMLRTSYPEEPLAYEGLVWTYLAMGRAADAVRAADGAHQLTPASRPNLRQLVQALLAAGDTARALAAMDSAAGRFPEVWGETHFLVRLGRGDPEGALRLLDSLARIAPAPGFGGQSPHRQMALLALGRLDEAMRQEQIVEQTHRMQFPPRAMMLQARVQLERGADSARTAALTREALGWLEDSDLSPPAVARLAERLADLAARQRDLATIAAVRRFVVARDAGRALPSFGYALTTLDAAAAYARGDYARAVSLLERARPGRFFGRSMATLLLLEADARRAAGDSLAANALDAVVRDRRYGFEGDGETWAVLRSVAQRGRVARTGERVVASTR